MGFAERAESWRAKAHLTGVRLPVLVGVTALAAIVLIAAGGALVKAGTSDGFSLSRDDGAATSDGTDEDGAASVEARTVFVHVGGAVVEPGVRELAEGARVQDAVDAAFASIARADDDPNDTALAIVEHYARSGVGSLRPVRTVPFSSDKKWSGATFANGESYVMGAGQFILGDAFVEVAEQQERLAADARVLLLARVEGFTEDGNLVTRDLLYDKATNKQFITVQTSGGNTFYIVIDYDKPTDEDGEQYQTYFLNTVDEADLLAAAEAAGVELASCSCSDKCAAGAVNTDCAVCAVNMTECAGVEQKPEPEPEPVAEPDAEPETEKGNAGMLLLVLAVAVLGGGAAFYFKVYRPKQQAATEPEEDYGEELEDYDGEEDGPPWDEDEDENEDTEDGE